MSEHDLPEELLALERALAGGPEADDAYIKRVMAKGDFLNTDPWSLWQFAGAVAAVIVMGVSLLLSLASDKSSGSWSSMQSIEHISGQIDPLQLGFSPDEIRSIAACYSVAKELPNIPPGIQTSPSVLQRINEYHKLMGD